jgi:NADPH-dependent curcumin reductase CurA
MEVNREVRLVTRPLGWPRESDFELAEASLGPLADNQVRVQNVYMSVDPYLRELMDGGSSPQAQLALGQTLEGAAVGRIVESTSRRFAVGDYVGSNLGWREYYVSNGKGLLRVDPRRAPLPTYLGALGLPGLTAYVGLLDIGHPVPGETVYISAAAGAVGNVVGQIAKLKGCRVVGSAGSDAKVDFLRRQLGFAAAFNYKKVDLPAALAEACPAGIDIYFDNVGGAHLEAALGHMRPFGRIPLCGMISGYNAEGPSPGPANLMAMVTSRLTMRGFLVSDHFTRLPRFFGEMSRWLAEGKVRSYETVVEGIENAPRAFLGLLRGENLGKMLVKLGPDSPAPVRAVGVT